ncbi:MAG: S10 family serine carboxypeptidase-like protein, partial [Paraburkholderia hospita]
MTNTESASGSSQSPHNSHATQEASAASASHKAGDHPFFDPVAYGNGPDDSVTDTSESAAITKHSITIGGKKLNYTATAGHLVTVDPSSSLPSAKIFYVAFTQDNQKEESRPLTFFYNGGPGSSSVFVLLGSFAPRRIKTSMPSFTPPAPY